MRTAIVAFLALAACSAWGADRTVTLTEAQENKLQFVAQGQNATPAQVVQAAVDRCLQQDIQLLESQQLEEVNAKLKGLSHAQRKELLDTIRGAR